MLLKDVQIGGTYKAKVTDKVVTIRLDAENPHGGWDATNLATGKKVRVKSAQRLRGPAGPTRAAVVDLAMEPPQTVIDAKNAGLPMPPKARRATKAAKDPKAKKVSGLDAAAIVLQDKGEMNVKDLVAEIFARKLWSSDGKTPAATLYSAMLREIDTKPVESRFSKTGRGLFAYRTPAKA
jgi:hypothetical protein